jgi:hypothetical protein
MTHEEHRRRHMVLDEAVMELCADYQRHNPLHPVETVYGRIITLNELLKWSHSQAINPTEDGESSAHVYSVCAKCGRSMLENEVHECEEVAG